MQSRRLTPIVIDAVLGLGLLCAALPAHAGADLQLTWQVEQATGKKRFDGKITLPERAQKGAAAQLEILKTDEPKGSQKLDVALARPKKKLRYLVKGVTDGAYIVHVRIDVDGDGEYGEGDLEGWYAGKGAEPAIARAAAVAVVVKKKRTGKLNFVVAKIAAGAAPAAEPAAEDGAEPTGDGEEKATGEEAKDAKEADAATKPAATDKPSWMGGASGPQVEGETRTLVGINFKAGSDPADAKAKAQAALDNVAEEFALLVAGLFGEDAKKARKEITDEQFDAVNAAVLAAAKVPDTIDEWLDPEGGAHAHLVTDVAQIAKRLAAATVPVADLAAWFGANAAKVHGAFVEYKK